MLISQIWPYTDRLNVLSLNYFFELLREPHFCKYMRALGNYYY